MKTVVKFNNDIQPDILHEVGDYYINQDSDLYILAQVKADHYCLINLSNGGRWDDPVTIHGVSPIGALTQTQFNSMCKDSLGNVNKFTRICEIEMKIKAN